ncbi:Transferase family [Phytophthora infestans]|nr:Transferase family [Phytophthora infestans]
MLYVKLDPNKSASAVPFLTDPACPQTTEQALDSLSYDFMPPPREGRHQLIAAKASILSDGALVIGLNFAHGVLDGEAAFTFVKVWAQRYRRLAGGPSNEIEAPIKLNHDRHLLSGHGNGVSAPHPELRVATPSDLSTQHESAKTKPMFGPIPVPVSDPAPTAQRTFHLTSDKLGRLKKLAGGARA